MTHTASASSYAEAPAAARALRSGPMPNFLIIGAARSGTTSLHYTLGQHPQIYMSPHKETNFFTFYCNGGRASQITRVEDVAAIEQSSIKTLSDYQAQFRGVSDEIAVGEASPSYLLAPGVAEAIHELIPAVKLIAVLRQPIDKAYSHFLWRCRVGVYSRSLEFAKALELDEERIRREGRGTSLLGGARYDLYLQRYFEVFGREQIKICLFDDMEARPQQFYEDIFHYLGVDSTYRPDFSTKFNQSGSPRSRLLAQLTHVSRPVKNELRRRLPPVAVTRLSRWQHKLRSANTMRPRSLPRGERRALTERYFAEGIANLEPLIGRDLSRWLV
ncbi:MAG: sulfotransferase [Kiloniellales bacterium]